MSDDKAQKLLQGGIKAARNGQNDLARKAFTQVLKLEPNNEAAWLGLATVTEENADKIRILNKILTINPDNDKAKEALRRLGVESEIEEEAPAIDEPEASPQVAEDDPWAATLAPEPTEEPDLDDFELPPLEIKPAAEELADAPAPSAGFKSLRSLRDTADDAEPAVPLDLDLEEPPEPEVVLMSSEEAFARAIPPPPGYDGIPIPNPARVRTLAPQVQAEINDYLWQALSEYETVNWTKKTRGRAGQGEYARFLTVSFITTFIIVGGILAAVATVILNDPTAQKLLFAPTWTPSPTFTPLPTTTPGLTNTPSPVPRLTLTPSPTLRPTVQPGGDDPFFPPPTPTTYYPAGISVDIVIDEVEALLRDGDLRGAFNILRTERESSGTTGDFTPYYYLVQVYLQQNNLSEATDAVDEYLENWGESGIAGNYRPMINLAQARIALYRAENDPAERNAAFDEAEELLTEVTDRLDPLYPDAYLLLADMYLQRNDTDDALDVISGAINSPSFQRLYVNLDLRMKRAEIYRIQGADDRALTEFAHILTINPFHEEALAQQAETALDADEAGRAVLASEQYLLYYPGSVRGHLLLGQARAAEFKYDLALNVLERAIEYGDEDSPYYPELLVARADINSRQGNFSSANSDLTRAGDSQSVRVLRVQSAFAAGNYGAVVRDAEALIGTGALPDGELRLLIGRAQVEQGNYDDGYENLSQALNVDGLSVIYRPLANEYIALAQYNLGDLDSALTAIQTALNADDTGSRRYIRGQIYEGLEEYARARGDYEFVVTWGQFYGYDFLSDAERRYTNVSARVGNS